MWPFGKKAKTSSEAQGRQPGSEPVNVWDLVSQMPQHELSDRAIPQHELSDRAIPQHELSDRATGNNQEEGGVEMTEKLIDLLQDMAGEIDGLLAICVAGADGEPIAYYAPPGSRWNMELSAAQLAQLLKLARISVDKMQAGQLEDALLTTADSYVLTKSLADDSFWLGMATSRDAVLGMVRLIAKTYAGRLAEAVPK